MLYLDIKELTTDTSLSVKPWKTSEYSSFNLNRFLDKDGHISVFIVTCRQHIEKRI